MSSYVIQFHDLVGLIDAKIREIRVAGGDVLSPEATEVCNYLTEVRDKLINDCDDNPILSYVFRP